MNSTKTQLKLSSRFLGPPRPHKDLDSFGMLVVQQEFILIFTGPNMSIQANGKLLDGLKFSIEHTLMLKYLIPL